MPVVDSLSSSSNFPLVLKPSNYTFQTIFWSYTSTNGGSGFYFGQSPFINTCVMTSNGILYIAGNFYISSGATNSQGTVTKVDLSYGKANVLWSNVYQCSGTYLTYTNNISYMFLDGLGYLWVCFATFYNNPGGLGTVVMKINITDGSVTSSVYSSVSSTYINAMSYFGINNTIFCIGSGGTKPRTIELNPSTFANAGSYEWTRSANQPSQFETSSYSSSATRTGGLANLALAGALIGSSSAYSIDIMIFTAYNSLTYAWNISGAAYINSGSTFIKYNDSIPNYWICTTSPEGGSYNSVYVLKMNTTGALSKWRYYVVSGTDGINSTGMVTDNSFTSMYISCDLQSNAKTTIIICIDLSTGNTKWATSIALTTAGSISQDKFKVATISPDGNNLILAGGELDFKTSNILSIPTNGSIPVPTIGYTYSGNSYVYTVSDYTGNIAVNLSSTYLSVSNVKSSWSGASFSPTFTSPAGFTSPAATSGNGLIQTGYNIGRGVASYPTISNLAANTLFSLNFDQSTISTLTDQGPNAYALKSISGSTTVLTSGGSSTNSVNYISSTSYYGGSSTSSVGFTKTTITQTVWNGCTVGNVSWSIECGCKPSTISGSSNYASTFIGESGNSAAFLLNKNGSTGVYQIQSSRWNSGLSASTSDFITVTGITEGSWNHIVISYTAVSATSGKLYAYVNGTYQGQLTIDKTTYDWRWSSSGDVIIGYYNNNWGIAVDNFKFLKYNPWPRAGFSLPANWKFI